MLYYFARWLQASPGNHQRNHARNQAVSDKGLSVDTEVDTRFLDTMPSGGFPW